METTKVITCRGCPADIRFLKNEDDAWVPVDVDPINIIEDSTGKIIGYRCNDGVRIRGHEFRALPRAHAHQVFEVYRSHYQTCLNPNLFSRGRKR